MDDIKTIGLLNNLIIVNNDRIEGYEMAIEETEENDLKLLFSQFIQTSVKCKSELLSEVRRLEAEAFISDRRKASFFTAWTEVKSALNSKNRKVILDACEEGENVVKKNYEDTIRDHGTDLSINELAMLKNQYMDLKNDHDRVEAMGQSVVM
ncbi:PA2169 family four-helix-bundle protein [Flavobacterium frigidarium]|uniref:PA2169 family four-helix-bundle protein n=1 Tax=Flavobacterium frigidarium TaxID=99286 RepID=UPI000422FCFE|nr:PA2169 family four-helix-bundle protein [Flavobacterium frigidarium]